MYPIGRASAVFAGLSYGATGYVDKPGIPRNANNLFYDVSTPREWTAEYNDRYRGYWNRNLSYKEILDKESDSLLSLLLVVAGIILFFMGFVVGFVLPPNITADFERGKVQIQHLWIKPTADIIHVTIGEAHVTYVGTPSAHRYLRGETEVPDLVCERLPRSGTLCYSCESPVVSTHPRLLQDRRRSPGPVPVEGDDHLLLGERSYVRREMTHQNQ